MTVAQSKIFHFHLHALAGVFIALTTYAFTACSNSELAGLDAEEASVIHCRDSNGKDSSTQENIHKTDSLQSNSPLVNSNKKDTTAQENLGKADSLQTISSQTDSTIIEPENIDSAILSERICDTIIDYLPLDDTEYPYAGIPRIVIETENHQAIKDRETEIPAKLQIWGEKAPESEIMELTIRGRGNSSWDSPKKSYKIEFIDKQTILGMPKDRDWALISNYADKTLIKNYLMYHLSAKLEAYYAPRCEYIELYINKEYLGIYLLTETIKISKNRVNIPNNDNSYIVEFDGKHHKGEQVFFSNVIKNDSIGKPFRVHSPKNASSETISTIEKHITDFETYLKKNDSKADNALEQWIDTDEYIKHYWAQEFSKNPDAIFYTSVFFCYTKNGVIKMGPIWDFDLAFGGHNQEGVNQTNQFFIKMYYWNTYIFKDPNMEALRKAYWINNRDVFTHTLDDVDSIYTILQDAAKNNFKKWNILQSTKYIYHRHTYNAYEEAIEDLKKWINERIQWIDKAISPP